MIAISLLAFVLLLGPAVAETPETPAPAPPAAGSEIESPPAATVAVPSGEVAQPKHVRIIYLGKQYKEPLPLSYADKPITDKGIEGARLGIKEANQAAAFTGHSYDLVEAIVPENGDVVAKAKEILANGDALIVADLEATDLLKVADLPEAKNSVIMNIRSSDEALRQEQCRSNIFHIIPDYAMRADALAQYLIWKKWPRWFVIRRNTPQDQDYSTQVKRAAGRFGGKIVAEKVYDLPPGSRNVDSGYQQVQTQIPEETQAAPDHDVVWVINSDDDFGDYLPYRTYLPRPIVGTQGLQAVAWDQSYTENGGMQFQNQIPRIAKRKPVERDYTALIGVRAFTEAVLRSEKEKPSELKVFLLSDQFKVQGYKGEALNFRTWDHQMRQPIILGGGTRVPVSTSPQEGFLHPVYLTDTLGFDAPETKCMFK